MLQVCCVVVPDRPRGSGTVTFVADRDKPASSSHRRDGRLLCGQCEQKLAHVVSIFTTHTHITSAVDLRSC